MFYNKSTNKSRGGLNLEEVYPTKDAVVITIVYSMFGIMWIWFSDTILGIIIKDEILYKRVQTLKGWIYVAITSFLIYFLIKKRTEFLKDSSIKLKETYDNLQKTHNELIVTEKKLESMIYNDTLTDLLTRVGLEVEMEDLIKEERPFFFVDIDFDNFRNINDIMGYSAGDMFIKDMAEKMSEFLNDYGFVGRIGGDEFGIIFIKSQTSFDLKELLYRINEILGDKWEYNDREFFISASMGVSNFPDDGMTVSEIIRNANLAMDSAKREGKGRCILYTGEILESTSEKIKIADKIRFGLLNNEFELYYQPQFHLQNGQIKGFEVLIRWTNSELGFISPAVFIPIAEEIGQIFDVEKWIFKNALVQKEIFEKKGYENISLSINLSSKTLMSDIHFGELEDILDEHKIDYQKITIEITETSVISDIHFAIEKLKRLKRYGLKIALDDFGTGYSSLTHLKKLPIDVIKLDKSFIKSMEKNSTDSYIIKAILGLAVDLGYEVVAEGIETKEQYIFLNGNSCSMGQGFLMSRPLNIEDVYRKLASGDSYVI